MQTPAPRHYLIVCDPVVGRGVTALVSGERATIGRAPTNTIVVHDERASRFHAEILPTGAGWAIRDLDSRNGTLLDGAPVTGECLLAPGGVISIGLAEITVHEGDPAATPAFRDPDSAGNTNTMPADLLAWQASITHRRARSRLLDDIHAGADAVPRVGRAAAELCRLAFALGRAADLRTAAALAIDSAIQGTGAARGIVLLPRRPVAAPAQANAAPESLEQAAATPESWPAAGVPAGIVAAVLTGNEALLAAAVTREATLSAPVRSHGHAVGVVHLEMAAAERTASPDDLEFLMAVCDALGLALDNLSAREALSTRLASTTDENERLRRRLGEDSLMIGASPALEGIAGQIDRVAATKSTVLVRGESGVGKELVARAIHESSERRAGPFVCLNCAALSETLLESELFGHEKGAFTGATERKIGKFEAAHRGTLMLDEIGEMTPAIQAKFLRVLEGHPFERVGGSTRVQVDVRVVAATNRNLEDAVTAGSFRRDLYFRLKVVEISVPPLRRRPEDIEPLAAHFLERFAAETGRRLRGYTPEALEALRSYHWPGNVRELRNAVERAVVLSQGEWIDVPDVSLSHLAAAGDTDRGMPRPVAFVPTSIEEMERRHVLATLEAVGGNKTKAAAILGIERSTLDRKLAKWARA
jgi:transcriptional regulator with GAF, ATPase, and Fis domain/pSer/pThr/pTyr-binding forkhead associated (FHA) protein